MSIVDDLEQSVDNTWNSISSAGAPAVIAGVENYAADQLKSSAASNQQAAQNAVNTAVASGGAATGVAASIQSVMAQIAQGTVFKQYGLYIILGVVGFYIVVKKVL